MFRTKKIKLRTKKYWCLGPNGWNNKGHFGYHQEGEK